MPVHGCRIQIWCECIMILRICEDAFFDRIVIDGEAGLQEAAELLDLIKEARAEGKGLYVDISEVSVLTFPVLQVLAVAVKEYRRHRMGLVFSAVSPSCEKTLEAAGLKRILAGCDKDAVGADYSI